MGADGAAAPIIRESGRFLSPRWPSFNRGVVFLILFVFSFRPLSARDIQALPALARLARSMSARGALLMLKLGLRRTERIERTDARVRTVVCHQAHRARAGCSPMRALVVAVDRRDLFRHFFFVIFRALPC